RGGDGMYRGEDVLKVRELFAKGLSKSAIARKLGIDRKTVSRLLEAGPTRRYQRAAQPQRPSKLDPYKEYILKRVLEDEVTNAQVILRENDLSIGDFVLQDALQDEVTNAQVILREIRSLG